MAYKYRVEYAFENNTIEEDHPLHHGRGSQEITTDLPIETQQQKDDVTKVIFRKVHASHGVTLVAVQAIIPQETGHKVIDAADFPGDDE